MFVFSVNGMIGRESLVILAQLSLIIAPKMDKPISHVQDWINSRIAIAFTRSYSCIIYGSQLPSPLQDREPDWDLESGIRLSH